MEDEPDAEHRGICALETLSKVAAEQSAELDEVTRPRISTGRPADTPNRDHSAPLVPLVPSHKRPRSRSRDPVKALRPSDSGIHKVRLSSGQISSQQVQPEPDEPVSSPTGNQSLQTQRRSAPAKGNLGIEKELRGSKSAPDLSAHALAAIRSIQAGTLQLDSSMRNKIAAAARRVLQAREIKRRTSNENVAQAATTQGESLAAATPSPQHSGSTATQAAQLPGSQVSTGMAQQPAEVVPTGAVSLPQSLATAAAIARGEPLPLTRTYQGLQPVQVLGDKAAGTTSSVSTASSSSFHHPVPGMTMHPVSSPSSTYRPFTVTTGVPRFAQGAGPVAMAPSTPQAATSQMMTVLPAPTRTASVGLCPGELQLPAQAPVSE